jgi:hypothetical protein
LLGFSREDRHRQREKARALVAKHKDKKGIFNRASLKF